ncbi:TIGR01212 family radical SAM protein [Clostridium isatidis]|mgnify:FL=1|uniref:TIGR01212 family radical SAM protein n=1 Tax=Clostridium isatidis TaxID=182773 RepID=A0A343J902_9CLOT|nr:TIGR01212 family radical SAM protein [Clostridium isatidis]ASW42010.1 TIGR01212 family radical SAM protein [Clostridium isatidis]NLZ35080.1 TIGR01212 family radical SAM protein [Clostridiales bacterium]
MKEWNGKRYHSFNYYLRNKFNEKVYKIALDGGFTCPNRDGKVGVGGCTFCSARGSGDFAGSRRLEITSQFEDRRKMMEKKWHSQKLIAYFQAYTNTYAPVDVLRKKYYEALNQENVVAMSIATRPDCIDDDVLDLLSEINEKTYLIVELGLQTVNDEVARSFNRGYDFEVFDNTLKRLLDRNIEVVVHSIFGLPGETEEDMMKTVDYIAHSGAKGIKFHLLHLMEKTKMAEQYRRGEFKLLEQDEYIDLVCKAIARIPEDMVVHRLTGDAPRELLIGPMWSLKKWEVLNAIDKALVDNDIWQGKNFK